MPILKIDKGAIKFEYLHSKTAIMDVDQAIRAFINYNVASYFIKSYPFSKLKFIFHSITDNL